MKKVLPMLIVFVLMLTACSNATQGASALPGAGSEVHAATTTPSESSSTAQNQSATTEAPSTPVVVVVADKEITLIVDGEAVTFLDSQPFIDGMETMSPARFIAEALGANVVWDDETQTAEFHKSWQLPPGQYESIVTLVADQADYFVRVKGPDLDATQVLTMDTPVIASGSRIFVLARYLAETLSATAEYDEETQTITINSVEPEYTVASEEAVTVSDTSQSSPAGSVPPTEVSKPTETAKPEGTTKPADPPKVESPTPTPAPTCQYDMNDPNVKKYPIYATAKSAEEFKAGSIGWQSAAEIIAHQKSPDNMIDGQTFYDWRMKPIQEWLDAYVSANGLSYKNKTDYEKTAIIRYLIEDGGNHNGGRLEEMIGLWRPDFQFSSGDCAPRAEALQFLMIAMDFQLIKTVSCTWGEAHATNAYWDSTVSAIRFVDADSFSSWNCFIDELDEWNFILD